MLFVKRGYLILLSGILIGFLAFLSILAPALLHTNQYEFIVERFTLGFLDVSYFDVALYASYLIVGILTAVISNRIGKRKAFIRTNVKSYFIFLRRLVLAQK